MAQLTPFNNPFMLGFDELENMLLRISKGAEGFPPYNIEQLSPSLLRISLAVAGYCETDLDVSLEDNQLIIRGRQEQDETRRFLHRGIAGRSFLKSFVLADGLIINGAYLENGLLNIDLKRPEKPKKVKQISIQTRKSPSQLLTPQEDNHE